MRDGADELGLVLAQNLVASNIAQHEYTPGGSPRLISHLGHARRESLSVIILPLDSFRAITVARQQCNKRLGADHFGNGLAHRHTCLDAESAFRRRVEQQNDAAIIY